MRRLRIVGIVSTLAAAAGSAVAWPLLPDTVPIHWNVHGEADDWGPKSWVALGGPLLVLAIWGLFEISARIDPRRPGLRAGGRETIYAILLGAIAAIHLATLAMAGGLIESAVNVIVALIGALFLLLGNFFSKVRPNWFAGIRTPWTLENDEIWRRTHRLAGRVFVAGGLLLVALALVAHGTALGVAVVAVTLLAALGPALYSYLLYRQLARG